MIPPLRHPLTNGPLEPLLVPASPARTRLLLVILLVIAMGVGCSSTSSPAGDASDTLGEVALPDGAATDTATMADVGFEWSLVDGGGDMPEPEAATIDDVLVLENPANVLSLFVEWQTSIEVATSLHVVCGDDYDQTFSAGETTSDHRVFVMGLHSGASCSLVITAAAPDAPVTTQEVAVTVGPLPDFLPPLDLVAVDQAAMEPGWTLFNLTNSFDDPPLVVAMVDEQGRYRWYHQRATADPGSDTAVSLLPEGVAIGGTHGQVWPAIVSWEGSVVWEQHIVMHHELEPLGDGRFLYLGDVKACDQEFSSGVLVEYDQPTDTILWEWRICEHYTPPVLQSDWSHLNTATPFPGEEALLVSSRNQNALFKVSWETGDILWKLGEAGDFSMPSEALFYHQHAPELQADGTILLFDNGLAGVREWSRAVQLAYDETTMAVSVVWEYVPSPAIFTPIWGDADRLPGGTTLVTFGERSDTDPSHLVEVTSDGTEVWHLVLPPKWGAYRSERVIEPPYGYVQPSP